jgi:hypothetical protein
MGALSAFSKWNVGYFTAENAGMYTNSYTIQMLAISWFYWPAIVFLVIFYIRIAKI